MKIFYVLIILISALTCAQAQNPDVQFIEPSKKWKLTSVNAGLGFDWANYENMSLQGVLSFAKNPDELQRNLQNMEEEATTFTAGVALYASASLSPFNYEKNAYNQNQEVRVGLTLYSPKEAMVSFKNEVMDTSIVYCNVHSELAVEGAYILKGKWGKRINWSIGLGANAGFTFGNQMILMSGKYFEPGRHPSEQESMQEDRYDAKNVYYMRAYIPYGLSYQVNEKVSAGFEARGGVGVQMISGEDSNFMQRTGSFILGIKYLLD